jgi:hypothetical protein
MALSTGGGAWRINFFRPCVSLKHAAMRLSTKKYNKYKKYNN